MSWNSIVEDVKAKHLVPDNFQTQQYIKELQSAEDELLRVARKCYKWLLYPAQDNPKVTKLKVKVFPLNTDGGTLESEIEKCA